ncbi:MAG: HDOD domain-containing protein [Chitinispirillales bacterium]|jgi:putative nucleotidyltransferase with HDIG domain|nr:HDOD domain-containing protein [Chitinispirillales bacterium]
MKYNGATKKADIESIRRVTQSVPVLPTLPTVVSKMLKVIDNRKASADTLARLISSDQALTAKLLKYANTPCYGYQREISTVNMAIMVLGFNTVKELVFGFSVIDVFKKPSPAVSDFDAVKFWEHSAACGVASRMLSRNSGSRFSGEAYVAGLLHDMGKIILNQYFGDDFLNVLKQAKECGLESAEMENLGVSHGEIGAWLAEKWNLPAIICDTVKNHHQPWNASADPAFVALITVADLLCHRIGMGNSGRSVLPEYDERLWDIFSKAAIPIDEPDLPQLQSDLLAELDKTENFVSFVQDDDSEL